jgi:hypothetical protein
MMTRHEAFDLLMAKALEDLRADQEAFVYCEGRGKRNEFIDSKMAEIRAATKIGDILQVVKRDRQGYDHLIEFIFRALGVADLRPNDLQMLREDSEDRLEGLGDKEEDPS